MVVIAGRDERDRAAVIDAICVRVNAFVQLRRDAEYQGPEKSRGSENRDESAPAIWQARDVAHCDASLCRIQSFRKTIFGSPLVAVVFDADCFPASILLSLTSSVEVNSLGQLQYLLG